ncbi:MAG: 1-acyl-sn-glycerol-3-phosphate acyltransferase [Chloroflexaceae bacterium]|nr:1-acyl-sn-glycerol-3-phosphate acyltransferase [Chloroflexaceae bacterium]
MPAQPPLSFIAPAFNPLVLRGTQALLPLWLRLNTEIRQVQATGLESLAELYHQFQTQKIRLLLAFRHPSVNDPLCLAYLIWHLLPQAAKDTKSPLKPPIHSHFLYDRGIPLWAGAWVGWLNARLGGVPIQRGKLDLTGLRTARDLLVNGQFPLAIAPEGATNGHNQLLSPLEPGIAQLSFWCLEDLHKAGRNETVFLVPIGIQYRYLTPPWDAVEQLLTQLEHNSGLSNTSENGDHTPEQLYHRLYALGEHLLTLMENFYREFYHQSLPPQLPADPSDPNRLLAERLHRLLDAALQVAEQYFALKPKGNFSDRCRRIEQAGWDCIYREDHKPTANLSPAERGLANLVAEEANLRLWHMRIVETFVATTGHYVKDRPTAERFAETSLLLWDLVARIQGSNPFHRPQLGPQQVTLTVAEPIAISPRWQAYQTNRRQAVATLTQDLQQALTNTIATDP